MRDLASLGVNGIFTDRPGLLRQVLGADASTSP
jgi:glycerophosphoryl diester phosphodiesterase